MTKPNEPSDGGALIAELRTAYEAKIEAMKKPRCDLAKSRAETAVPRAIEAAREAAAAGRTTAFIDAGFDVGPDQLDFGTEFDDMNVALDKILLEKYGLRCSMAAHPYQGKLQIWWWSR